MIVAKETISDLLYYDGKPVLEVYIEYPQVDGPYKKTSEKNFNIFYVNKAKFENRKARIYMYRQVIARYNAAKKENFPFMVNSYRSSFNAEYVSKDYISILFDVYTFTGGAHGDTVRTSDTWDMKKGRRVTLSEICPECTDKKVKEIIARQISEAHDDELFEDAVLLSAKYYDSSNFYIKDGDIYIFYPLYSIAPYSSGFKSFKIAEL